MRKPSINNSDNHPHQFWTPTSIEGPSSTTWFSMLVRFFDTQAYWGGKRLIFKPISFDRKEFPLIKQENFRIPQTIWEVEEKVHRINHFVLGSHILATAATLIAPALAHAHVIAPVFYLTPAIPLFTLFVKVYYKFYEVYPKLPFTTQSIMTNIQQKLKDNPKNCDLIALEASLNLKSKNFNLVNRSLETILFDCEQLEHPHAQFILNQMTQKASVTCHLDKIHHSELLAFKAYCHYKKESPIKDICQELQAIFKMNQEQKVAMAIMTELLKSHPENSDVLILQAKFLYQKKTEISQVLFSLEKALLQVPEHSEGNKFLDFLLKNHPNSADLQALKASHLYHSKKGTKDILLFLQRALKLDPNHKQASSLVEKLLERVQIEIKNNPPNLGELHTLLNHLLILKASYFYHRVKQAGKVGEQVHEVLNLINQVLDNNALHTTARELLNQITQDCLATENISTNPNLLALLGRLTYHYSNESLKIYAFPFAKKTVEINPQHLGAQELLNLFRTTQGSFIQVDADTTPLRISNALNQYFGTSPEGIAITINSPVSPQVKHNSYWPSFSKLFGLGETLPSKKIPAQASVEKVSTILSQENLVRLKNLSISLLGG